MKNFWQQLQERERWALGIGATVSLIYLCYLILIAPLSNSVSQKQKMLQDKKNLLAWMRIAETKNIPKPNLNQNGHVALPSLLTETLKKNQLDGFTYQIQQSQHDLIQLSFTEVPFNLFMKWLMNFCMKHQSNIESLSAEKTNTPGMVKLSLELKTK